MNSKNAAFTLMELMVTLAILVILITVAVPTYLAARDRAYDNTAKQTVVNVARAQSAYWGGSSPSAYLTSSDMPDEQLPYIFKDTAQTTGPVTNPPTVGVVISSAGAAINNVCTVTTPSESGRYAQVIITNGVIGEANLHLPSDDPPPSDPPPEDPPEEDPPPSSSCPLLFAWNGDRYEFVSDFLGASVLGYRIGSAYGENMYLPIDNDEYLKIDGNLLKEEKGTYKFKVNEMLQEISYLDKLELITVDHPASEEIYPNEGFNFINEELKVLSVNKEIIPKKATNENGKDILNYISKEDRIYAPFTKIGIDGFTKPRALILDLGEIDKDSTLFMSGWTEYPDSGTVKNKSDILTAEEFGITVDLPSLEVIGKDGKWKEVTPFMGMPAGLNKTFAFPLQDKNGKSIFETSDTRIMIKTNQRVYYDKIWVSQNRENSQLNRLKPSKAHLGYYGFASFTSKDGKEPGIFNYENKIKPLEINVSGYATRHGDVLSLLKEGDDKFVIMTPGDEISLEFKSENLPELKKGYKRDYLLYAKGYFKASRPGRAYAYTIEPLPFKDMFNVGGYQFYPYDKIPNPVSLTLHGIIAGNEYGFHVGPEGYAYTAIDYFKRYTGMAASNRYPDDDEHNDYRKKYNTRYIQPGKTEYENRENVPLLK